MITRLLVANRGEIARRIFATCRRLGIATVAVASDADAEALHAREADHTVRLPGRAPADTYLRADLVVAAARAAGADAVHPGYGFLAENADFAAAVLDAGLVWVGPPPKAIAAMGSKLEAKQLLEQAGVPMLESWTDAQTVTRFPVLVKASAGGGGRGMRVARSAGELTEAYPAAAREAEAAFGDGTVFCERYVETGRHIEVQVFADAHGTVIALGERECSIQRRHQKIVEEAPSPAVDEDLRARLFDAAVTAARAVGYVGAGTVEFLLEESSGDFFFLEMNTRLQVEHPVTEAVTGLDLVRWQLLVADGEPLPLTQAPPTRGHAVEVRLYAEDPAADWRPSTGTLHRFAVPDAALAFAPHRFDGVRLDSAVTDGSSRDRRAQSSIVSIHYDPMLAKVIAWAPTRAEAARALAGALARAELHGVVTNRDLLVRILRESEFLAGGTDTAYLNRHPEVFAPLLPAAEEPVAYLAASLAAAARRRAGTQWAGFPVAWRNVPYGPQSTVFRGGIEVHHTLDRDGRLVDGPDGVTLHSATPETVTLEVSGVVTTYRVHAVGEVSYVDGPAGSLVAIEEPRFAPPVADQAPGTLLAPMPGAVGRVVVTVGQRVAKGDLLLTLEAMKLEHAIRAPEAGTVTDLPVPPGGQVEAGAVLAIVTPEIETSTEEPA